MSDLISRQAVLDKFKALCDACGEGEKYNGVMCRCCALDDGICIVEDAPDAEPEERMAKVEVVEKPNVFKCSECGQYFHQTAWGSLVEYCSRCGARLEWI